MTSNRTPPTPSADGFFSRWSRRKDAQRQGAPVEEPIAPPLPTMQAANDAAAANARDESLPSAPTNAAAELEPARPLSLHDAQALHAESDFAPFMARGVAPDVRNAAMKQLFADPHYNVMDGLDIYIDDYTKTVPLPTAVIKRMVAAQFLGLFEHDAEPVAEASKATDSVVDVVAGAALPTESHVVAGAEVTDATSSSDSCGPALPLDEMQAATRTET